MEFPIFFLRVERYNVYFYTLQCPSRWQHMYKMKSSTGRRNLQLFVKYFIFLS